MDNHFPEPDAPEKVERMQFGKFVAILITGVALLFCFIMMATTYSGVVEMMVAAMIGAMGTFFLHDACFPPGKIFGKWIPFLERNFRDNLKNPISFLANPLGLCAYCQNLWVVMTTFIVMSFVIPMNWWLLLPCLFIGHIFLNILDKIFWP